jgi:hypothetical protein
MMFLCGGLVFAAIATAINVVWLLSMRRAERVAVARVAPREVVQGVEYLSVRGKAAGMGR